ncbi:MAG: hypothetical protein SCM88_00525, partial [Bacillota bacterium]|nr:hypothetical protein [Bacillota bacterium]
YTTSYPNGNSAVVKAGDEDDAVVIEIMNTYIPPDCETAWAANGDVPGSLPYNPGRGGNWATYVQYSYETKTVNIYAGQKYLVGTATLSALDNEMVTITINLDGATFCANGTTNVYVQDYEDAPSGNPSPGRFKWKETVSGTSTSIDVDANNFYGIHLNVQ